MAIITEVQDRVSTYPGRVKLTPVSGQTNVYDMIRADQPVQEGTPLNKALFDQKANTLTEDVTVYVTLGGNDFSGDGSSVAPYRTIQAAINAIPRHLGGHTATIDIAEGTYEERINVEGFSSGKLIVGQPQRNVVVRGVNVVNSNHVTFNISNVTWASGFSGTIFYVGYNSSVSIGYAMTVRCAGSTEVGIGVTFNSRLNADGAAVTVSNCERSAILVTYGSNASLATVAGSNNTAAGLVSERGSILSYATATIASDFGNISRTGGRILTGSGSELAPASVV